MGDVLKGVQADSFAISSDASSGMSVTLVLGPLCHGSFFGTLFHGSFVGLTDVRRFKLLCFLEDALADL